MTNQNQQPLLPLPPLEDVLKAVRSHDSTSEDKTDYKTGYEYLKKEVKELRGVIKQLEGIIKTQPNIEKNIQTCECPILERHSGRGRIQVLTNSGSKHNKVVCEHVYLWESMDGKFYHCILTGQNCSYVYSNSTGD
ncbi:MAG: hypothetical protein AABX17_01440 [Nanoarchaeota archaeon]